MNDDPKNKLGEMFSSGVQDFSLKRGESPGMRYIRFAYWLKSMISMLNPELICYEQANHRGGAATEVSYGLISQIQFVCAENKTPHANVHATTLKKFWLGKGRGDKSVMIAECKRRGFKPQDDNEADAIAGWHWAQAEYGATP
jgi:Holliday junction resolvasome RuvABC endonuclease subunit